MGDPSLDEISSRVEALLAELRAHSDPGVAERAEDLVRLLMELYGAGLARTLELAGDDLEGRLADDPLVGGLLVIHGLHPETAEERVGRALDEVRPYLGSHAGGVEFLGIDDDGIASVALQGTCDGCASSAATLTYAIEAAIRKAAPEVVEVRAVNVPQSAPGLLQIASRPPPGACVPT